MGQNTVSTNWLILHSYCFSAENISENSLPSIMILFLCNVYFIAEAKEVDNMCSHQSEKDIHIKSPAETRKIQSITKKRKSGERSTPVRTSPRKKLAIENVRSNTDDLSSKLRETQSAVVTNTSRINSVREETKKEEDTSQRSCPDPTNRLQTESEGIDSTVKVGVKKSRALQRKSKTSISTEKNGETSDSRCNGYHKAKHHLIDYKYPKERVSSKKTKSASPVDQGHGDKSLENDNSVELGNKKTLNHENEFEEKGLGVNDEDHVNKNTDQESEKVVGMDSSASSDVSSDDELLADAFSPSQESSKFIVYTLL